MSNPAIGDSIIHIVLIEDHDLTRIGLRTALQRQPDIKVVAEAANATQGLQLLEQYQPDVAVIDIGLPDMDGIDLTRTFRQLPIAHDQASSTRILMLTMHDTEDSVLAAFAAGADSYCLKDISTDKLVDAIRATQSGQSWIDPSIAKVVLRQMQQDGSAQSDAAKTVKIAAAEPEYTQMLETYPLTERELEILELIVAGQNNAAIAENLHISLGTVKTHVRNILHKLCADDRTQAAVRALRSGLVA